MNLNYNTLHLYNLAEIIDIVKNSRDEAIIDNLNNLTKNIIINSNFIPIESKQYILTKIGY